MATPGTVITEDEQYERLSDFYLRLWKQLDLASGNSKWLQVAPTSQSELREEAESILREIASARRSSAPLNDGSVLEKDFKKTQELVEQANQQDGSGLDGFRDYLGELALRYSELAEEN